MTVKKIPAFYSVSQYPNPVLRAGYDRRSILKRSKAGLNSDIFFS